MKFTTGVLYLEKDKLTYSFPGSERIGHHHVGEDRHKRRGGHAFRVHFENCSPHVMAKGLEEYDDYENYFIGKDPSRWASGVKVYRSVGYHNIYPGIDLVMEESKGHLKYSFVVQPQADPSDIEMRFEGVERIYLENGILNYTTSVNHVREENLFAYQIISGGMVEIPCSFRLNESKVSFEISEQYNRSIPLVIDPVLVFSTFTGSASDNFGFTATYDTTGHLYAGGIVFGYDYPKTTGAYDVTFNGGNVDVSITKFTPDGSGLIYSTYLGGGESENPSSIVVNDQDELIILGSTSSPDFPTTSGAFDRSFNGGTYKEYPNNGPYFYSGTDIFISKLSAAGSQLIGSTFIGGSGNDGLNDTSSTFTGFFGTLVYNYGDQFRGEVITDDIGNIYGVSSTQSSNFPVTLGAFQQNSGGGQDAVVFKFNSNLTSLLWASYLGGSGTDAGYNILTDNHQQVYVSGGTASSNFPATSGSLNSSYLGGRADGYIAQISANGNSILQATFIGTNRYDQSYFIDQDADGMVYVVGQTEGNYPVTSNVYSNPNSGQFIAALTPDLSSTAFSTIFGTGDGDPDISPTAFLIDNCRNIYVSGWAGSRLMNNVNSYFNSTTIGLPITSDAYQSTTDSDGSDFYFLVLEHDAASLKYATYFGGRYSDDHVDGGTSRFDKNGIIYQAVCAGCGGYSDFPTTPGAWSQRNESFNCNEGLIKFRFDLIGVDVAVVAHPETEGCVPLTVSFTADEINANNIWWDFGDGTTSMLPATVHTYNNPGTYLVTLIGIDTTTCYGITFSDTAYIVITARDDSIAARFNPVINSNCDSFVVGLNNSSLNAAGQFWDFGDGITSTEVSPVHRYAAPGTYDITLIIYNAAKCNTFDTLVKTIELIANIDAAIAIPDTFGCVPFTVGFNDASAGGVSFLWDFGDGNFSVEQNPIHTYDDTGTYTITLIATDPASCNIHDTATATVIVSDDSLSAGFSLDTLAFECDSLAISLTNESFNFTSIFWDFGDGTTSSALNPQHFYNRSDSFEITLIAFNTATCNETDTSAKIIFLPPPVQAAFDADNGCPPHDVSVNNRSVNAVNYLWRYGGGASTGTTPNLSGLSSGNYSLTLTAYNPNSCNDSSVVTGSFIVYDQPVSFFTTDDSVYNFLEEVAFINESEGAVAYVWNFGDGQNSTMENPFHAYGDSAVYFPCLEAVNEFGCDSNYCKRIEIDFRGAIDVPNAFSPNGDGSNDMLYVRGEGVRDLEFRIYNRWGELVFESTDPDIVCNELNECIVNGKGWDGTYKGEPQEMEVYVYTLRAVFVNGKSSQLKKGNITLLR